MKLDRISISELIPTGSFSNRRLSVEAELQPGDDPSTCMDDLKKFIEGKHKEYFPPYYQESLPEVSIIPATNKDSKESTIQRTVNDINSCKELKVLESYRLIAKSNPTLQEAYDNKLKTFIE